MGIKGLLRPIYRRTQRVQHLFLLNILRILFSPKQISSRVSLGYVSGGKNDGLGAQLQRVLALNGLGTYLSLTVEHSPIESIAVHPLDGFRDERELAAFVTQVNRVIDAEENDSQAGDDVYYFNEVSFLDFVRVFFQVLIFRNCIRMQITHPYSLVDAKPGIYRCVLNSKISERLSKLASRNLNMQIAVHHRQGVGGKVVQPGQAIPREMDFDSYRAPITNTKVELGDLKVVLFTDAPLEDISFEPPKDQISSWQGLPAFDGAKMEIKSKSFSEFQGTDRLFSEIVRGGNPLVTLADISSASGMILCRSSFGYVAALLSSSNSVWIPRDFWHPALPGWHTYNVDR